MKVLIVDDEPSNVDILQDWLEEDGMTTMQAYDGEDGWNLLEKHPDTSIILLDKMMPVLDGIEFLQRIKTHPNYKDIPVIMQTAAADSQSMIEGINAGVYYYLAKPFRRQVLLSLVRAAMYDFKHIREITSEVRKQQQTLGLIQSAHFEFRTHEEAQNLACFISTSYPDPERVVLGISEMLLNAVEHGNLDIGFETKGQLVTNGTFQEEIHRRQNLPKNNKKSVHVWFEQTPDLLTLKIKDEGKGFNWKDFMEMTPSRATDPNGRGIVMSRIMSFDDIQYSPKGNEVTCIVKLKKDSK